MAFPAYGYGAPAPPQFSPYQPGFQPQNPTAFALFQAVDKDRSGQVSINELHMALSNGGYTAFSKRTTRLLMKMFDTNPRDGQLNYQEFEQLINQLHAWRAWFEHSDADRSGKLSKDEVAACLRNFGFNLADPLVISIFNAYDEDASGAVAFDEYIQLLAEINALTSLFRRYDPHGTGHANLDYSTFLSIVFSTRS